MPIRRLLLCEGPDDCAFFRAFLKAYPALPRFRVKSNATKTDPKGGNSKFGSGLEAHYRLGGPFRDVLIVSDNDEKPKESFERVHAQVRDFFGFAPDAPRELAGNAPRIMILMIPWDNVPGNLETACLVAAHSADRGMAAEIQRFAALCRVDDWESEVTPQEMRLQTSLAVRCKQNPFVSIRDVFEEAKYQSLIPLTDNSFKSIYDTLNRFA